MPYTIVLSPPVDQAMKYVSASQGLYKSYKPQYLLSDNGTSSPHITIVQFDCDSLELAHQVWAMMCDKMKQERFEPFTPPFSGVSFIEGVGPYEGTTWIELSIARGEVTSPIMKVHYAALEVLEFFNLKPLNASGNNYRPHLTLARIAMPKQLEMCPKSLLENPGKFKLEFGLSDKKWQFAESLDTFPKSILKT